MRRGSGMSLLSSEAPSLGWSYLSDVSLANVSNISVISLPISLNELSNAAHYAQESTQGKTSYPQNPLGAALRSPPGFAPSKNSGEELAFSGLPFNNTIPVLNIAILGWCASGVMASVHDLPLLILCTFYTYLLML